MLMVLLRITARRLMILSVAVTVSPIQMPVKQRPAELYFTQVEVVLLPV